VRERRFRPGNEHAQLESHDTENERPGKPTWPGKRTLTSQRPFDLALAGMRHVRAVVAERRLDGEPLSGLEALAYARHLKLGLPRQRDPDLSAPSLLDERVRERGPLEPAPGTGVTALRDQSLRTVFQPDQPSASAGWSGSLRGVMRAIGEGVPLQSWAGISTTVANAIAALGARAEATRVGVDLTELLGEVGDLLGLVAAARHAVEPEERRSLEDKLREATDRYGEHLAEIAMRASTLGVPTELGVPGDQISDELYAAIDERLPVLRAPDRREDRVRVTVRDEALRALVTGEILTLANILALDPEDLDVRVDELAASRLASAGVRGMQEGDAVFVHPDVFAADTTEGKYLLAHEMIHAAQRRLPSRNDLGYVEAEAEATSLGRAYASGLGLMRPSIGLAGRAAAHDDPKPDNQKVLASPLRLSRRVELWRVQYVPPGDLKWIGGLDKKRQALASVLLDLVGGSAYSVALLEEAITQQGGLTTISGPGHLEGPATQDEAVQAFGVAAKMMLDLVGWLTTTKKLNVSLTPAHLATLNAGLDGGDTWPDIKSELPPWMSETLYAVLMASTHVDDLTSYAKAVRLAREQPTAANQRTVKAERTKVLAVLNPPIRALEAVRKDKALAKEQAYWVLWDTGADAAGGEPKSAPADKRPAGGPAYYFIVDAMTDVELARRAPTDAAARKQLLERFSTRQSLRDTGGGGDMIVRQGVPKPSRPPLRGTLSTYPALEAPFYDTPKGGDREFVMNIEFPDVFEAFRGYAYKFEVLQIPQSQLEQLAEIAEDRTRRGDTPGQLDVLGNRFSRDADYGAADLRKGVEALTSELGTPGVAALTLTAANSILRFAATAIKTFFETLFKPRYEKTIPFKDPGLYVVRCIAWPKPSDTSVIDRVPTATWMPIWVRPASDMSKLRVDLDTKVREGSVERLKEIAVELAKQPGPGPVERKALEDEKQQIETLLNGKGDAQLQQEKSQLQGALAKATNDREKKQLAKRIKEIDEVLEMRKSRIAGAKTDGSLEGLTRIPAAFVGDNAQTIRPLFEVFQKANLGKSLVYHAVDSTTENSGHRDGSGKTREAAIIAAIKRILESDQGYGRGSVTLSIPAAPGAVGGKPTVETVRIEKSLGSLAMEAVDNLAMIASIAAMAAAPFTGGASLALLVPIGIIGAIPSAYRLIDRGMQGTLRLDMATAMDVVNILGAAIGAGQASAGAKAAVRGVPLGKAWMILGLGNDGLGMAVAGAALIDQIEQATSDPNMPVGMKRAIVAQLLGTQLTQLGLSVGAQLSAHGKAQGESIQRGKHVEVTHAPVEPALQQKFREAAGSKGSDIVVVRDAEGKTVAGDGVEIHYDLDGYGLPTNLRVIAGPNANADHIMLHGKTVKVMLEYQGLSGYLRNLLDRMITMFRGGTADPPAGSRAYNAKIELQKLPHAIEIVHQDLAKGNITAEAAQSKIKDYREQMRTYEAALGDFSAGPRVIAARDTVTQKAIAEGYPNVDGHFYKEMTDGTYQLETDARVKVDPKHVVKENGRWVAKDGAAPPQQHTDITVTRVQAAQALGVADTQVKIHADAKFDHVSVRPKPDGSYEVHFAPNKSEAKIRDAIDRHRALKARRPADLKSRPKKPVWSGADEAAYLGRPDAASGDHWALSNDGELSYHRGEAIPGEKSKMYDEASGTVVENPKGSVDEKFEVGLSKEQVFEQLGGNDAGSPFGEWVKQITERVDGAGGPGKKVTIDELIGKLEGNKGGPIKGRGTFDGMAHRTVRENLKAQYTDKLVKTLTDIPDLKESHKAMLEVTSKMGSGDRGSISEQWYKAKYESGATAHVEFKKSDQTPVDPKKPTQGQTPRDLPLTKDRVPDLVNGDQLKDVKHVKSVLDQGDRAQIDEYVNVLVGQKITINGKEYNLKKATVVFTEPVGGGKNADYIAAKTSKDLEFEIFNRSGERRTINEASLERHQRDARALAADIRAWVDT